MCFSTDICVFRESGWLKILWQPLQLLFTETSFSMVCCTCHRSKNLLRYVKNGNLSWCQHLHPWHQKRWSRALMWRAWHLQLCLECWCCNSLAEDVVVNFSGWEWFHWAWSLIVWCCCCCHCHQKRWSGAFLWRTWHLQLCLEHWCCHLLREGAVMNFSGWGISFFVWCCHCH